LVLGLSRFAEHQALLAAAELLRVSDVLRALTGRL
jgi:hypothetical protein